MEESKTPEEHKNWKKHNFLGKYDIEDYLSDESDNEAPSTAPQDNVTVSTTPAVQNRSNKRQITMNSWLGTQQDNSNTNQSLNQQTSDATQNPIDPSTSANTHQTNRNQSSIAVWMNPAAQQQPRNNRSHSLEDNTNASHLENQRLEPRSSSNNCNLNRSSQRRSQHNLPLSSEGSQIFKRRRLKKEYKIFCHVRLNTWKLHSVRIV